MYTQALLLFPATRFTLSTGRRAFSLPPIMCANVVAEAAKFGCCMVGARSLCIIEESQILPAEPRLISSSEGRVGRHPSPWPFSTLARLDVSRFADLGDREPAASAKSLTVIILQQGDADGIAVVFDDSKRAWSLR
jgi:hypothetical protein